MYSNLQISRTLAKNDIRMENPKKTVSQEAMQAEWLEIQGAQKSPAAFRPLYDRYYDPIFRFVYRRTGNENLTADICAQVFLKALQQIHNYKFKGVPFSAWLYRIASNEIAQHFRNNQKNRMVSLDEQHLDFMVEDMEHSANYKEQNRQALLQALSDLKLPDLQLIELRFFEQRPFKEIADILDITESNAKVKTYRILEKMKKRMLNNNRGPGRAPIA